MNRERALKTIHWNTNWSLCNEQTHASFCRNCASAVVIPAHLFVKAVDKVRRICFGLRYHICKKFEIVQLFRESYFLNSNNSEVIKMCFSFSLYQQSLPVSPLKTEFVLYRCPFVSSNKHPYYDIYRSIGDLRTKIRFLFLTIICIFLRIIKIYKVFSARKIELCKEEAKKFI